MGHALPRHGVPLWTENAVCAASARIVALLVLALGGLGACSSSTTSSNTPCETTESCTLGEVCVQGFCVAEGQSDVVDRVRDVPSPEDAVDRETTADTDTDNAADDTRSDTDPRGEDDFLTPCTQDSECDVNFCIDPGNGGLCTRRCADDSMCAEAEGWRCRLVDSPFQELIRVCYPDPTTLCDPCTTDTTCGGSSDRCVELLQGRTHCGLDCRANGVCPSGYECIAFGEDIRQCVPTRRDCGPCQFADLQADLEHCGACYQTCSLQNATPACLDGQCTIDSCEDGFASCDNFQDTGCETDLRSAVEHCGACGEACPTGALCEDGACRCPAGQLVCDGACVAPNACGGCSALAAEPESTCGPCGLDVYACDGTEAVTCASETFTNACDGCAALSNEPGAGCGPCGIDQWVCSADGEAVVCNGETTENACGGCAPLAGTPNVSACGDCETGTYVCDGTETLRCEGASTINLQADNQNCGSCGSACPAGTQCENGGCTCLDGGLACEGSCHPRTPCGACDTGTLVCRDGALACEGDATDACGACDGFDRIVGAACGTCGVWACGGAEAASWQCEERDLQTDPNHCGTCNQACLATQTCEAGTCVGEPLDAQVWIREHATDFVALEQHLIGLGYTVAREGGTLTAAQLERHEVLILDPAALAAGPGLVTPADLEAFVRGGGGVVVLGGPGEDNRAPWCADVNPYLRRLGMHFSRSSTAGVICNSGNFASGTNLIALVTQHALTRNQTLRTSDFAQRSGFEVNDASGPASTSLATVQAERTVLRVSSPGSGRVVAVSDGRIGRAMETANEAFWRQAIEWVARTR